MERMNTAPKRVRTIPATVQPLNVYSTEYLLKRVAAYCRVSTKQEEQLNSYETQVRYYTDRINREPGWKLAGIYADKGITGTSMKKRDEFNKLIRQCKRGKVDMIIMRALDIFMSIPDLLFTMVVVAALGSSIPVLIIAMTLAYFTNYVRLVRSGVLNLVDQEYVEAARAGGSSSARIILSHIIPNTLGIILVNVTLNVSSLVIYQSTLSFIGLSLPAPAPEWGSMLSSARVDMLRAPTLVLFPALAIVLTAFSVNLLGDGLRDAMDPRLKN